MLKFIRNIVICLLCVCLLFGAFIAVGQTVSYQYDKTFYAAMRDKFDKNISRTEPYIMFVGGSSLAFGLDTKTLSQELDRPAYNFGFHAGLKRDFYLNAVKANIMKGDVIVLAFEYGLYIEDLMTEDITWYSIDNDIRLIKCIPSSDRFNLFRYYPIFLYKKISDALFDPHPVPKKESYRYDVFNEYGDVVVDKYENMRTPEEIKNTAHIRIEKAGISDKAVKSLREFKEYCERLGAEVYITFPCIDENAVKFIENDGKDLKMYLEKETGIKVISEVSDYILDTELFYDTDYHLNTNGVKIRTNMLIKDLKKVLR